MSKFKTVKRERVPDFSVEESNVAIAQRGRVICGCRKCESMGRRCCTFMDENIQL